MVDERNFEPRLGRIRSSGSGRDKSYLRPERKADGSLTIAKDHAERGAKFYQGSAGSKVELLSPMPFYDLAKRRAHLAGSKSGGEQSDARA